MAFFCCRWPCSVRCDADSEFVVTDTESADVDSHGASSPEVPKADGEASPDPSSPLLSPAEVDEERWAQCNYVHERKHQGDDISESTDCPAEDSEEEVTPSGILGDQEVMLCKADWWDAADLSAWLDGRENLARPARLCCTKVVQHAASLSSSDLTAPWQPGMAESLYEDMGAQSSKLSYLAVWLKLNGSSLVFLSALPQSAACDAVSQADLVEGRLKLILNPVQVKLPLPTKGPKDAETVGSFFGKKATHTSITQTSSGAEVACIQIDLYAKWVMRMALQQVGFRLGNVLELILVDWTGQRVLASIRLAVTTDFLQLLK